MVALQRMIESTQKAGGTQVSFRISNVRQELRVDYAASLEGVTELRVEHHCLSQPPRPIKQLRRH